MTNYEMVKNFSIENMALSIMCLYEMGYLKSLFRCKEYNGKCINVVMSGCKKRARESNGKNLQKLLLVQT